MEETRTKIDIGEKIFHVVFFALAFVVIGKLLPDIYYHYLDQTQYYSIDIPVRVDKTVYHPCDTLIMDVSRNSLVDTDATSYLELVLVRDSGANIEVSKFTRQIVLSKGQQEIGVPLPIDCNLTPGTYFYQGIVGFTVNGVDKHTPFNTDSFQVIN